MSSPPWWQGAAIYQVYPRSFADSNGDGVGDLPGVRARLPDLAWLGVDAIWLSPFYPSPMVDFGYDVSDHCDVDPLFGTLEDFDALVSDAHALGIRVIIDWVPNHTSDAHPWFVDARSGPDSAHRNWYVWRDGGEDGAPPNNWAAAFEAEAPAWTLDPDSEQWYLHLFDPAQPDLNWDESGVEAAMHDILRFWLDRGVDGIRADVIHCIGKDPDLPDDPPEVVGIPHVALNDMAITHQRLRRIRKLVDDYPGDRVVVGEVYLLSTDAVATYYGNGDELHLSFNFPPLYARWDAAKWRRCIEDTARAFDPRQAWPTWVLSNHDNPRHRSRYDLGAGLLGEDGDTRTRRSEARARAAAVLLLTLRGTPFLFQGEEMGLVDAVISDEQQVDPGKRDGCRAPIPWDGSSDHGWPVGNGSTWLPFPPDADTRNYAAQRHQRGSVLHLYRRLLQLRRQTPGMVLGTQNLLAAPEGVLAYSRVHADERWVVLINFTDGPVVLDDLGGRAVAGGAPPIVEIASDGEGEGEAFSGSLRPDQALVLRA